MIAIRHLAAAASLGIVTIATAAFAQAPTRTERVQFPRGAFSTSVRGTVQGYQSIDYVIGARQGQMLTVSMRTSYRSAYFNVLPPRGDTALFVGPSAGNRYSGRLAATGDYRVRVYLMRNAARRGERAAFSLDVGVSGATTGGGTGPAGAGPMISASNMPAFCRGEAASRYGTRPNYVQVGRIARAPDGGSIIDGSVDSGREGAKRFRCRFDARNRFIEVMPISRVG